VIEALVLGRKRARYASAVSATLVSPTKPKHASRSGSGLGDLWRVIVLNDDHNTFDGVAQALAAVLPGISFDAGMRLATEIDRTGQAIVWIGHRELAELYWSQLETRGLTMAPLES
jgi:ATP-dependent Clp protease adaptor protein ClpS